MAAGHFSLLAQREVTKRKAPSRPRSPVKPATSQARCGGLLTGHPWPAANARASCACPCGLFPSRTCRDREGTRKEKKSKALLLLSGPSVTRRRADGKGP